MFGAEIGQARFRMEGGRAQRAAGWRRHSTAQKTPPGGAYGATLPEDGEGFERWSAPTASRTEENPSLRNNAASSVLIWPINPKPWKTSAEYSWTREAPARIFA